MIARSYVGNLDYGLAATSHALLRTHPGNEFVSILLLRMNWGFCAIARGLPASVLLSTLNLAIKTSRNFRERGGNGHLSAFQSKIPLKDRKVKSSKSSGTILALQIKSVPLCAHNRSRRLRSLQESYLAKNIESGHLHFSVTTGK